jgi:imidazole glycerol phosphate synthase, glutamine amidotransferase subunit
MKATIIDYGIGNILSVARALSNCGTEILVTDSPEEIINSEALILPGVGAFGDGMRGLREKNLLEPIKIYASKGHPFMGICLGMQMMLSTSEEFGIHEGLSLIPGRVVRMEGTTIHGEPHKIPHIGWNNLRLPLGKTNSFWEKPSYQALKKMKKCILFILILLFPIMKNTVLLMPTMEAG